MAKTEILSFKVDPELKAAAEEVLTALGLSFNTAVNIFLRQIIFHNGMPFRIEKYHKKDENEKRQVT